MSNPKHAGVLEADGRTVVAANGEGHRLDSVELAVWQAANGETTPAELVDVARRHDATVTLQNVFAILDDLSDRELLATRTAPPATGIERRDLFRRMALGAAAVGVAPLLLTRPAQALDAGTYLTSSRLKLGAQEEQKKKDQRHYRKQVAEEAKDKSRLDAQESRLKENGASDQRLREEATAKQDSKKEEVQIKADPRAAWPDTDSQATLCENYSSNRPFGPGQSLVFVKTPLGSITAEADLAKIAFSPTPSGDLFVDMEIVHTDDEKSAALLARALADSIKSQQPLFVQFGAFGEFAAELVPVADSFSVDVSSKVLSTAGSARSDTLTLHYNKIKWTYTPLR